MTVPRRLRPSSDERQLAINKTPRVLSAGGGQPLAAPVVNVSGVAGMTPFEYVFHGDDPDVARPTALLVFWVGAATPNNGQVTDFIYPVTL